MGAIALVAAAAVAGMVNALAGGGSLITFPVLLATGLPAVVANVTNTLALVPGYVGGLLSQRQDLRGQRQRMQWLVPAAAAGGLAGALLLLNTSERLFSSLVPWLIWLGSLLLAVQEPLRQWLLRRTGSLESGAEAQWALIPVLLAAVYG
ncbi:MAG: sulfite exporter TauE/SafE family protein, partial [Synechococcaceae bacterium WB9_2_170]|nr:sulfite exporter TauE/SafE family protein [Synechococcaceae bacterium WB9_2_170]